MAELLKKLAQLVSDVKNFNDDSAEMTRWVCPGRYFYLGCTIIGCGIIYSKSWPLEKLVFNFCSSLGYAILSFWGHHILQHFDVALWFAVLSLANLGVFVYRLHDAFESLKSPSPAMLPLYEMLFAPMNVDPKTFNDLVACSEGVQSIEANDLFAAEGQRNAGNELSVLLTGKLIATQNDQTLHTILPGQFMDSPEWEAFDPKNTKQFRVTVVAETNSTYITWRRASIEKLMRRNRYLTHMMNLIIGRDIAYKLYNTEASVWSPIPSSKRINNNNQNNNNNNNLMSSGGSGLGNGFPTGHQGVSGGLTEENFEEGFITPYSSAESKQSEV